MANDRWHTQQLMLSYKVLFPVPGVSVALAYMAYNPCSLTRYFSQFQEFPWRWLTWLPWLVCVINKFQSQRLRALNMYRKAPNFCGPKFCENVENQANVNFCDKIFLVSCGEPTTMAVTKTQNRLEWNGTECIVIFWLLTKNFDLGLGISTLSF